MARELSKKNLEMVLMQAMMAAKNVRTQHDRLLELRRRLQRHQADADADAKLGEIASDVFKVYYFGLDAGAKMLSGLAKVGLSDASATAKTGSKPRDTASGRDADKALDYLCRAIRMTTLAIKHIDVVVAVLSRFLDPDELARLAEVTDGAAYLGVEISQPTTSPDPSTD
ncbi:unnamed protein product [Triticum turgidum subsp. durum]|uniref:Uncharacterized protein n=1 Tax=Triticum turgidum subsp. durum TaxID=4567 RepID=A0A9R1QV61_TRITD|nr:unnamed protein product [Triticum turgidum subsp. durum]